MFDVPLAFSTIEFGEPTDIYGTAGSVWYRVAPQASRPTRPISPSRPSPRARAFSVARPTINGLRRISSGVTYGGSHASVSFNGLRGHVYYLRVATDARCPRP